MSDKKAIKDSEVKLVNQVKSRRKLVKTLLIGGGSVLTVSQIPSKWVKPIVNSVVLPTHAQTSTNVIPNPSCELFSSTATSVTGTHCRCGGSLDTVYFPFTIAGGGSTDFTIGAATAVDPVDDATNVGALSLEYLVDELRLTLIRPAGGAIGALHQCDFISMDSSNLELFGFTDLDSVPRSVSFTVNRADFNGFPVSTATNIVVSPP